MYNVGLACTALSTATLGLPNPTASMVLIDGNTGMATSVIASGVNTVIKAGYTPLILTSGQLITVSGLKCFNSSASPLVAQAISTSFNGSIYMNYTEKPGFPQGNWLTQKVALVRLRVA